MAVLSSFGALTLTRSVGRAMASGKASTVLQQESKVSAKRSHLEVHRLSQRICLRNGCVKQTYHNCSRSCDKKEEKFSLKAKKNKLCGRPPQYARPCKLTFDLLTLKVVSESRVTWAIHMCQF